MRHLFRPRSRTPSSTARILDIDRTTLYNKLRRYGLR